MAPEVWVLVQEQWPPPRTSQLDPLHRAARIAQPVR
jgi:hypothetical protein